MKIVFITSEKIIGGGETNLKNLATENGCAKVRSKDCMRYFTSKIFFNRWDFISRSYFSN